MILETKEVNKILTAKIMRQEANLEIAEIFKKEVMHLIVDGYKQIALNFEKVTYVDSSFLGAMVSSLKYALAQGAEIYLTDLKKDIIDLLRLIRMDKVFKIYNTVNEIA